MALLTSIGWFLAFVAIFLAVIAWGSFVLHDYVMAVYWWMWLKRRTVVRIPATNRDVTETLIPSESKVLTYPRFQSEVAAWCGENLSGQFGVAPFMSWAGAGHKRDRKIWFTNSDDAFVFRLRWK